MKNTITMEYKRQYRDLPDEVKQRISASTKGKAKSYDHKQHISQGMKKYWRNVPSRNEPEKKNGQYTTYQGEEIIKNNEKK